VRESITAIGELTVRVVSFQFTLPILAQMSNTTYPSRLSMPQFMLLVELAKMTVCIRSVQLDLPTSCFSPLVTNNNGALLEC
jgi:hypothetical protein